jgi:GTP-binding protein Era
MEIEFRSGFVNLIGLPNSGKSTLLNALTGEKMAIISPKPQTTRQRILALINEPTFQIIFSDTPGFIEQANYPLHQTMNMQVRLAFEDADVILLVIDSTLPCNLSESFLQMLKDSSIPIILCLNKIDRGKDNHVNEIIPFLEDYQLPIKSIHKVSALQQTGISELLEDIKFMLPVHPAYYPDDILSNRPVRFFISELIREKIYQLYDAEIPYHTFVVVENCKGVDEKKEMAIIDAFIFVGKQSHIPILIGKQGSKLKELGTKSRLEIEQYLDQKVYLNLSVKLRKDWRNNSTFLNKSSVFQ